jgi:hypothetical protein
MYSVGQTIVITKSIARLIGTAENEDRLGVQSFTHLSSLTQN